MLQKTVFLFESLRAICIFPVVNVQVIIAGLFPGQHLKNSITASKTHFGLYNLLVISTMKLLFFTLLIKEPFKKHSINRSLRLAKCCFNSFKNSHFLLNLNMYFIHKLRYNFVQHF